MIVVPGHHRDTLQELLDATNHTAPGPLPDTAAFTGGLADWAQGTPFERAFAAADEQLQLRKEQLREVVAPWEHEADTFVAFSRELEGLREPGDLIQHTLNRLLRVMDFDQAAYAILEEDQLVYVHEAHRDGVPAPEPGLHVPVPLAGTAFQRVQRTRTTEWSTDYPSTPGALPQVVEQGVKSGMVTPVLRQGHVMATIVLCTVNRWQTITPHMRKTVELTVLRLEHALELRRAVGEVRSTLEAGMRTLSRVLEARDAETQGHTARAARLATRLGAHFRLDRTALEHLRYGAYLHDIGKLCIPERILKKPGKLTPEERATMQRHATEGHDLVTRLPGVAPQIVAVIRSHHERWDGRGYPDGLAGTDIPLGARIFSVCDVYDALISERPYKRAWSHDDAVLEIERQAGGQFDPEVVRAFLALVRDP
ncbi:HD domain-containing phosphohydrolase [Deinococcus sonorensis]|uniref:HD domain-containing phosphohydrolase n=1 Tax=Deinococcus sonorensis KR-87 TaxID=694439 RepID=A0AAU7U710_9DEIO